MASASRPPVVGRLPAVPRKRRKEARPSELTAAALELFVERGFAATRLDDVAAHAGVSKGTLYLYFDSKEALFKAVIAEGIVPRFVAAAQEMATFEGASLDLMRHLLRTWWAQIGNTPLAGVAKLILSESRNFPEVAQYYHEQVIAHGRSLMRAVLARGVARGEFRAVDIESAIDVIFSPLLMLVLSRYSVGFCGRADNPDRFLETHFDLLTRGLCVSEGSR